MSLKQDLEYYLEREVSAEEVQEAEEWQNQNPGADISEYVSAIKELEDVMLGIMKTQNPIVDGKVQGGTRS